MAVILMCPVRPGDDNEELRYAARSWEKNLLLPDLLLIVVGHCPPWLNPDGVVSGNHYQSSALAVFDNVRLGAEAAKVYNQYLMMNDDFFCMDPMDSMLPVRRDITLAQHVALAGGKTAVPWGRSLDLTASWLSEAGFPRPWSWEGHRPLLAVPGQVFEAAERWLASVSGSQTTLPDAVPQLRTLYATLNNVIGYPAEDAKLGSNGSGVGTPWLSTSDQSWRKYRASIIKRFPHPSRWER